MYAHSKMLTRLLHIRPNIRTQAKKNDFIEPAEAPGEGRRRIPSDKENRDSALASRDFRELAAKGTQLAPTHNNLLTSLTPQ